MLPLAGAWCPKSRLMATAASIQPSRSRDSEGGNVCRVERVCVFSLPLHAGVTSALRPPMCLTMWHKRAFAIFAAIFNPLAHPQARSLQSLPMPVPRSHLRASRPGVQSHATCVRACWVTKAARARARDETRDRAAQRSSLLSVKNRMLPTEQRRGLEGRCCMLPNQCACTCARDQPVAQR